MLKRSYLILMVGLMLLLALGVGGCAKKKVETEPRTNIEEQPVPGDMGTMGGQEAGKSGMAGAEEYGLSAEEKARMAAEKEAARKQALIEEVTAKTDISEPVYFEFDSFELKPEAREELKKKAEVLKDYPDLKLVVEGHCDERGTEEYNLALGERRARAAYEYLMLLGVDSSRMQIISYGEERPAVEGSNEAVWAKNRRAEFRLF